MKGKIRGIWLLIYITHIQISDNIIYHSYFNIILAVLLKGLEERESVMTSVALNDCKGVSIGTFLDDYGIELWTVLKPMAIFDPSPI